MGLKDENISWETSIPTLVECAFWARKNAYAPYSKFLVGACVFARHPESGWLGYFRGVNVENASYGLTICAERSAIFNAISHGYTEIFALACVAPQLPGVVGTSCGACRQVMYEFNPDMRVFYADEKKTIFMETTPRMLLPEAFTLGVKSE